MGLSKQGKKYRHWRGMWYTVTIRIDASFITPVTRSRDLLSRV